MDILFLFPSQGSSTGLPVGSVIAWPFADGIPQNYLECNGQDVNAALYPKLAALCSSVPNYQGMFLRGYGSQSYKQNNGSTIGITSTIYASGNLKNIQGDSVRVVHNRVSLFGVVIGWNPMGTGYEEGVFKDSSGISTNFDTHWAHNGSGNLDFNLSNVLPTDNEIRPVNIAVRYIIKAK